MRSSENSKLARTRTLLLTWTWNVGLLAAKRRDIFVGGGESEPCKGGVGPPLAHGFVSVGLGGNFRPVPQVFGRQRLAGA